MAVIHVVNDTIHPSGQTYEQSTPREVNVRNAMYILTVGAPIVAAVLCLFSTPNWAARRTLYSFPKLCALWFLSIGLVGIGIYHEHALTPRLIFVVAGIHGQVEVMISVLLLGANAKQALAAAWIWSFVQFGAALSLKSPVSVYMVAAILGGANDFMMFQEFAYAKQWGFALGAIGHLISAETVFTGIVANIGVINWNVLSFVGLWIHIFFMVGGILTARRVPPSPEKTPGDNPPPVEYGDPPSNPLYYVHWEPAVVGTMYAIALSLSTVITLFLAFVLPAPM